MSEEKTPSPDKISEIGKVSNETLYRVMMEIQATQLSNKTQLTTIQASIASNFTQLQAEIAAVQGNCNTKTAALTTTVTEFKTSLDFAHDTIKEHKESIDLLKKEITALKNKNSEQDMNRDEVKSELKCVSSKQERMERRSREWGIRIFGVKEHDNEDTRKVICQLFLDKKITNCTNLDAVSSLIEHCHRLPSRYPNKPRPIIANLMTRPIRQRILKDAHANLNRKADNNIYILGDMTKEDFDLKQQARPQMQAAYKDGKKAMFVKGKLYIDSHQTAIKKPT